MRLTNTSWPRVPGSRLAPTTATDRGASSRWMERASDQCSLASRTDRETSVGSTGNVRWATPSSYDRAGW